MLGQGRLCSAPSSVKVSYDQFRSAVEVRSRFDEAGTLRRRDFLSFLVIFLPRGVSVVREEETNQVKPNGKIALQLHCLSVATTF
jgi:hypothetical protein